MGVIKLIQEVGRGDQADAETVQPRENAGTGDQSGSEVQLKVGNRMELDACISGRDTVRE